MVSERSSALLKNSLTVMRGAASKGEGRHLRLQKHFKKHFSRNISGFRGVQLYGSTTVSLTFGDGTIENVIMTPRRARGARSRRSTKCEIKKYAKKHTDRSRLTSEDSKKNVFQSCVCKTQENPSYLGEWQDTRSALKAERTMRKKPSMLVKA